MVVSSHYLASDVGVSVLKAGGNAVDAAIATGLALAVVHPAAGNIGGGGFMIAYMNDGTVTAFDFREKAPAAAREDMYVDEYGKYIHDLNHEGYLSVGVPGTVAGFDLASKRLGTMPWKELAQPAVELAEDGFPLSWSLARAFKAYAPHFRRYPASEKKFLRNDGSFYESEDIWRQPDLAESLKRIRDHGKAGFYEGETARLLASDMARNGGLITEADLAAYEAVEREPVQGTYRGYDIISMCPPSSGGSTLIEMLNILEGFDLRASGHNSARYVHLLAEAMRLAFADRAAYLGDPDFNPDLPLEMLLSKEYATERRKLISDTLAGVSKPGDILPPEGEQTTHYSVVDQYGNAVVVTYTLEYGYGSRIVADGLGFLLNNEMGDFNPVPGYTDSLGKIGSKPNRVAPGKRMLSSMTPTIIAQNGKPWALVGTPGGRTIINSVLQVTLNLLDFDMNISEAVAAKRIHHQWLPDRLRLERRALSSDSREILTSMGHRIQDRGYQGSVMAIRIDHRNNILWGASDPRSADAAAVGY
jgi:gamma-glutamyltranspeptidase/glutathione hydrolase